MEVVVTTSTISRAKLQSNRHHQQTNTKFFYKPDVLSVAQPTNMVHGVSVNKTRVKKGTVDPYKPSLPPNIYSLSPLF